MPQTDHFAKMRAQLSPKGTAEVVNLTAHLANPYFDAGHVAPAIDHGEKRLALLSALGDVDRPLSPLETFALEVLMRASGQFLPAHA